MTGGPRGVAEMDEEQSVERERSARALVAARDCFDTLFENAPVMLHSVDEEWRLLRVNRCWTESLGYEKDEVLGRRCTDFLADESRQRATEDSLPLLWRVGAFHSVAFQLIKQDGGRLDVLVDAEVVSSASEKRFTLSALQNPFDTRQWRQASGTIAALKELTRVQRRYEAALPIGGIMYPALAIPAEEREDAAPESSGRVSIDLEYDRLNLRLSASLVDQGRSVSAPTLTTRELEVLRILESGAGNKEIAHHLSLSVRTVRFHIENLYRKLGVQSRTRAVRVGREAGLLAS